MKKLYFYCMSGGCMDPNKDMNGCWQLKQILDYNNISYEILDINMRISGETGRNNYKELQNITESRSVIAPTLVIKENNQVIAWSNQKTDWGDDFQTNSQNLLQWLLDNGIN